MEYVSKACPFCGGTEIHKSEGGGCVCAYCLQPFDVTSGKLSEGYTKLESYNFVGAQAFFQSMISVADVANEAKYGVFLAKNRIEENKQGGNIHPVVYSYRPDPFDFDEEYKFLRTLFAGDAAVSNKLTKIEKARAETLTPRYDCDVIVFTDDQTDPVCDEFLKTLSSRGIKALKITDGFSIDAGTLRCAEAAYVFASNLDTVNKMITSGVARKYALLENARMRKSGIGKKPTKLVCKIPVPEILTDGVRDVLDVAETLNLTAEVRRLGSILNKSGITAVAPARRDRESVISKPNYTRDRIRTAVAEIKNEQGDLDRIKRSLEHGAFDDALHQAEKMQRNGCQSARMFWYAYMAKSHTKDVSDFVNYADESAFSDEALELCDRALYSCATVEEAKPYVTALTKAAMRLIDRKKANLASRALDAAFTYDFADDYVDDLLDRLNAAKSSLAPADWFGLQRKVLERVSAATPQFLLKNTCNAIDYALTLGDYARADEMIEGILDYFPSESSLYERKICCDNKVNSYDKIFTIDYPRLGDSFAYYVASQKGNAYNVLRRAFDTFMAKAEAEGFDKYAKALDETLSLGQMPELCGGATVFTLGDMCKVGELALKSGNFDFASAYFMDAIRRDKTCYEAYWGALKAELRCRDDKQLEECETAIDGEGASNYYGNAYNTAYAKGDTAFVERIDRVRRRQSNTKKRDGHAYRSDDFVIENGNVVKYLGSGTQKVLVSGGAYRIGAYAMRGCDCKSVIVDNGVTSIGDGAFAFSDIEQITLPLSVHEIGVNPFCGCTKLKNIICGGNLKFTGGALYAGNKLICVLSGVGVGGTSFTVAAGTNTVGSKAFYKIDGIKEVRLNDCDNLENCAFYGCEGLKISGAAPREIAALTGEGIYGDGKLKGGVIKPEGDRWESLYGSSCNNMASDGETKGGVPEYRKLIDTAGKITSGILIKNGVALYTVGATLYAAKLDDALDGKPVSPVRIPLLYPTVGTGALWNEYLIQPTERDRCSIEYIAPNGKSEYQIKIGDPLTRPLCLMGDYLLLVSHSTVISVNLARGAIVAKKLMGEKLTAVTCASGGKFITAGERNLYALTPDLSGGSVHTLSGVTYSSSGSGKILRGRIVSYGGVAYFIERNDMNSLLCCYDGVKTYVKPVPRSVVEVFQNQPVFYNNRFYCADKKSLVCADVEPLDSEWSFKFVQSVNDKFMEIAVVGGAPYVNYMDERKNLCLRSLYKGRVILVDLSNGGIYAGRI